MGLESSDVVRFGLGPLLQGQTMVHWLLSCLSGGYKFASVPLCIGIVINSVI